MIRGCIGGLGGDKIEGKHAVSWTIELGQKTPKDGRWSIMTVHSEAEAVRQAKEYLDIGFVVNAIKRPDGSIAHDQDQITRISKRRLNGEASSCPAPSAPWRLTICRSKLRPRFMMIAWYATPCWTYSLISPAKAAFGVMPKSSARPKCSAWQTRRVIRPTYAPPPRSN